MSTKGGGKDDDTQEETIPASAKAVVDFRSRRVSLAASLNAQLRGLLVALEDCVEISAELASRSLSGVDDQRASQILTFALTATVFLEKAVKDLAARLEAILASKKNE